MEKVKTFAICLLLIGVLLSYSLIYQLWMDKRILQNKVNDLESVIRVHEIIKEMTRREYRKQKNNTFNKWFLIRFAQVFAFLAMFLVLEFLFMAILIGASHQHDLKLELIKTGQYVGER